jgi:hypothetical protein
MGEWKRSSFCSDSNCVEVKATKDLVFLRNSAGDQVISFTWEEWDAFVEGVQAGEFRA